PERPRWHCVRVQAIKKTRLLTLAELRQSPDLQTLRVLTKGNRLSITPITPPEWKTLQNLLL
uniref:EVE domain-containing protein n=1 Tax=Ferrovum sp. TaxID=2609467 RepID=UPI0026169EC3